MTQRDRWAKRPAVMRYRAYCDQVRELGIVVPPAGAHITFIMPMPPSWSRKKRDSLRGQPHQQKPDVDNLAKALLDALFADDCGIWDIHLTKRWGDSGAIVITY